MHSSGWYKLTSLLAREDILEFSQPVVAAALPMSKYQNFSHNLLCTQIHQLALLIHFQRIHHYRMLIATTLSTSGALTSLQRISCSWTGAGFGSPPSSLRSDKSLYLSHRVARFQILSGVDHAAHLVPALEPAGLDRPDLRDALLQRTPHRALLHAQPTLRQRQAQVQVRFVLN